MNNYEVSEQMKQRLETNFQYHKPIGNQPERYELLRNAMKSVAYLIVMNSPISREQSEALTLLENCSMWTNAAIARNENE